MNDQEALVIVLMIVKEWLDDAASSSGAPGQSEPEERIGQPWVAIEEAIERVMDFMPPVTQSVKKVGSIKNTRQFYD